ncbi:MAG: nicotinate-nucleotide adenylyltransferase [Verrucomicrobiota bacterium]
MQHIGLYGGSFDPIHTGHVLVGQAALEELQLERLFFIPAARSPFKPEQTPAPCEQRLAMIRMALAGRANCEVDDVEIQRGGTSFTVDTVRYFAQRFPAAKLFYLIGADNVPGLSKWREADMLAKLAEFVVIPRPGDAPVPLSAPFRGQYLKGFSFGVSASQIRARVKAGQPIEPLVPAAVAEVIRNYQLYL